MSNEIKLNNIKINNEVYGSTDASDIKYKSTTVKAELDKFQSLLTLLPNAQILTQAAYNALGDQVKDDDVVYYIIDSGADGEAKNLKYNNTNSNIPATNVQDALDACFQYVNDGKELLATSLTNMGTPTANNATLKTIAKRADEMLAYQQEYGVVKGIATGIAESRTGNAMASHVVQGQTFSNSTAANIEGTMPVNVSSDKRIVANAYDTVYAIPKGYHDGAGRIIVAAEQEKQPLMTCEMVQACYYKGDSEAGSVVNVQGYNKMSRKINGYNNVQTLTLLAYKPNGIFDTLSTSVNNLTDVDVSPYVYLEQIFNAKDKSSSPYVNCTFTISV